VKVRDGTYRGARGGALARRARRAVGGVGAAGRVELRAHRHEVALAVEQHGVLRGRAGEEGSRSSEERGGAQHLGSLPHGPVPPLLPPNALDLSERCVKQR